MAGPGWLCQPVVPPGAKCRLRTTKSDGLILALMVGVWTLARSPKVPLPIGVGVTPWLGVAAATPTGAASATRTTATTSHLGALVCIGLPPVPTPTSSPPSRTGV
jgi:hypothetical protein